MMFFTECLRGPMLTLGFLILRSQCLDLSVAVDQHHSNLCRGVRVQIILETLSIESGDDAAVRGSSVGRKLVLSYHTDEDSI